MYLAPFSHSTSLTDGWQTNRRTDGQTDDNHDKGPTIKLTAYGRPKNETR